MNGEEEVVAAEEEEELVQSMSLTFENGLIRLNIPFVHAKTLKVDLKSGNMTLITQGFANVYLLFCKTVQGFLSLASSLDRNSIYNRC